MAKCFPPRLKSRKGCQKCRCLRLGHKILLALHTLQLKTSHCDGVTELDLINYISSCFKIDGDIEDQVRSILAVLIRPGFVVKRCNRFRLMGSSARVQCSPCNSSRRQKAIDHVSNIYLMCDNGDNRITCRRESCGKENASSCDAVCKNNSRPCTPRRSRGRPCKRRGRSGQKKSRSTSANCDKCDLEDNQE